MRAPLLMLLAVLAAVPVSAGTPAPRQIDSKAVFQVDPAMAYITYRAHVRIQARFVRAVGPDELAAWTAKRNAAFAKARRRYEHDLAEYQAEEASWLKMEKPARQQVATPVMPDEVTSETFAFPPPELDTMVQAEAAPIFDKGDQGFTYLIPVKPGTYTFYGPVGMGPNGYAGICLCMGSVKFDAAAGKITDLGEIRVPAEEVVDRDYFASHPIAGGSRDPAGRFPVELVPAHDPESPVGRLAGLPVVAADLHAADKIANYFGVLIDRLPAIPGVLAYQRDRVIDLKAPPAGGGVN